MFSAISDSRWIAVCIYLHTLRELSSEYANALTGFLALLPHPTKAVYPLNLPSPFSFRFWHPDQQSGGWTGRESAGPAIVLLERHRARQLPPPPRTQLETSAHPHPHRGCLLTHSFSS